MRTKPPPITQTHRGPPQTIPSSAKTPPAPTGLSASTGHMLMPQSGLPWWWWWYCCAWYRCGLCLPAPQMLRHQGLLKCRCRMLFNDLKVLLLRRPPPAPLPMHGEPQPPGVAANNTLPALGAGGRAGWRGPREGVGRETPPLPPSAEDDWGGPAAEPPALLLSSASSDDFCKGKAEDRYSLGSSLDSGMRTPLCRICFQGPEQVRPFFPFPASFWDLQVWQVATRLLALGNHCAVSSVRTVSFKGSSMMSHVVKFAQEVSGAWRSLFGGSVVPHVCIFLPVLNWNMFNSIQKFHKHPQSRRFRSWKG